MINISWQGYSPEKAVLRESVWRRLEVMNAAIGSPGGHIPNFLGATDAAANLAKLAVWQSARVVKCNPDRAQTPVRQRALMEGKLLYMAVPQLREEACFVALQPQQFPQEEIATKDAVLQHGQPISFDQMKPIDLAVVGCVAASPAGGRTGKGAGFADLEFALLYRFALIHSRTAIATTIHDEQLVAATQLPLESHDWPLDWICTPTQAIASDRQQPRPRGLDWDHIQPHQWETIPILKTLYETERS